ncbi:MAG TPA: glycosyltransferase 87 family protein [Candidatus Dormibacteraeota bacterium]|nr:glycosyltransferase 87 family protein [Candidatus Dormibacteraeota bacterium]
MASLASAAAALENRATRVRASVAASPAVRAAVTPFVAAKLVTFLVVVVVVWSTSSVAGHPSLSDFVHPFGFWDGANYIDIATRGYPAGPLDLVPGHPGHLWGFFPGLPILLRAGMFIFGDATSTGIVVSFVGEFLALYYLARLVLLERHGDKGAARVACWALAFFPDAVFLSLVYTDSVFMAAAIASLYYMRRGDQLPACVAAAVAVAVHVTGLVLLPALLVEYLWRRRRLGWGVVGIAAAAAPALVFFLYAWHQTGDFFAYTTVLQSAPYGGRHLAFPAAGFLTTVQTGLGDHTASYTFFFLSDAIWGAAGLVALWYFAVNWRRFAPSLTLFSAGVWLSVTCLTYWQGLMRYEIAFIPLYLAVADLWRRRPETATIVLAVSAGWMVIQTYAFATGRFIV